MNETKCKFCRIVSGELPASIIYEDADVMALMNIRAINKGECMVIPKDHIDHFTDIPDNLSAKILAVAQKIGRKLLALYKPERIGYVVHGYGVPPLTSWLCPKMIPTTLYPASSFGLWTGSSTSATSISP